MRLSRYVQLNPDVIDSSLQRLSCVSQNITDVDIDSVRLSLALKDSLPTPVQHAIIELLPQRSTNERDRVGIHGSGMNVAIALSLHTVLLSRNRITSTIGLLQFKNVVRLSLLGNRLQRIEDCEALSLLSSLQYLSLEFNPVTQLPHYRAHMLRICSWPEVLQPKNCRLRKLDARSVVALEVERASQCLQREKVTMGELVQRMRFVAFLIEAKKRIELHHELRRRGVVVQDIMVNLTVENVVTRCSGQLLTFVDIGAASHFARRLMSGRCRMCDMDADDRVFASESLCKSDSSVLAQSPNHSQGDINLLSLHHPRQAVLTAFCKDWSRDVFRRVTTALDRRICGLLLDIAHSLGEELSVVDVDHLNKLWFIQVAKIDNWKIRQQQLRCKEDRGEQTEEGSFVASRRSVNAPRRRLECQVTPVREEPMEIVLTPSKGSVAEEPTIKGIEEELSLTLISPIPHRTEAGGFGNVGDTSVGRGCESRKASPTSEDKENGRALNGTVPDQAAKHVECDIDLLSICNAQRTPWRAPLPHPSPWKEETVVAEDLFLIDRHMKRRALCLWSVRLKEKRDQQLCFRFVRDKLTGLITTASPTTHSICTALVLLPRTEKKRVIFRFWFDQARHHYLPRSFHLGTLLLRWRRRAYEARNAAYADDYHRSRIVRVTWDCWRRQLRGTVDPEQGHLQTRPLSMGEPLGGPEPQQLFAGASPTSASEPSTQPKEAKLLQRGVVPIDTDNLAPNEKRALDCVRDGDPVSPLGGSPDTAQRLLPLTAARTIEASAPVKRLGVSDTTTQTGKGLSTHGSTAADQPPHCRVDAEVAVAALAQDRLRLVDRIVALELRANKEALTVQHRDREIEELKKKLGLMALREECLESTLNDYKKKCEHLQAVVQALRTERREMLLSVSR